MAACSLLLTAVATPQANSRFLTGLDARFGMTSAD